MTKFIAARALALVPLVLGVSMLTFFMLHLVPGDPVRAMLGETSFASVEDIERLRRQLGLDLPVHVQYANYVVAAVQGDLGNSMRTRRPIADEIARRLPSTFALALSGLVFAAVFGTALGVISALYQNTWIDNLSTTIALLGASIPSFWLGLMLIFVFSIQLGWLPVLGDAGWKGLILPAATLGLWAAAGIARLVRSGMLEVIRQDFVRTARAKGVRESVVIQRHVLRNAMIPVVTLLGIRFGEVLAGTVIIETVFARPGLGLQLVNSIISKDIPMVQGIVLFIAIVYLIVNFGVEVAYAWLDPRIQYG